MQSSLPGRHAPSSNVIVTPVADAVQWTSCARKPFVPRNPPLLWIFDVADPGQFTPDLNRQVICSRLIALLAREYMATLIRYTQRFAPPRIVVRPQMFDRREQGKELSAPSGRWLNDHLDAAIKAPRVGCVKASALTS